MEDKQELISTSMEFEEEEIYEKIEAPKFVDFTHPSHFSPDDRFWFCSRVGCDQKHEEEMDLEAINKNFVLRVMAARSPNVRFRRAITRKPLSGSKKCPLTAPPKTSKSRLPRLALVSSSISKKLIIDEEDGKLIKVPPRKVKPSSTPKARVKHVAAKYMTSPRKNKGSSLKPNNEFRSAQNPTKTSISLPKSKVVAKALVFNSPKKILNKKETKEMSTTTPMTKLCEGVKKLQINSQKKGVSRKPFIESASERKRLPLDSSRKIPSSRKAKTLETEAKCSRNVESPGFRTLKSKKCSLPIRSGTGLDQCTPLPATEAKCSRNLKSPGLGTLKLKETALPVQSSPGLDQYTIEAPSVDEKSRELDSISEVEDGKENKSEIEGGEVVGKTSTEETYEETKEPNLDEQSQEIVKPNVVSEHETDEDKENALNFADIRNLNSENLNMHNASEKLKVKTKQNTQKMDKTTKENHPVGTGAQLLKNRKLKTTNPKPFRLRTDERGILKEATLERKVHFTENSSAPTENSQGIGNGVTEKGSSMKDESKSLKKDQLRTIKSRYKTQMKVKTKSEESSQKAKLPQKQNHAGLQTKHDLPIKSRGPYATETTISRLKDSRNQGKKADVLISKASAVKKLGAQGNKTGTTAREPKFHSLQRQKVAQ